MGLPGSNREGLFFCNILNRKCNIENRALLMTGNDTRTQGGAKMNLDLITSEEFAQAIGVATGTLANWRCTGLVKIPYVKIGSHVRYRRSDIERWIEQQIVHASGTPAASGAA